jgi:hypothetical protein
MPLFIPPILGWALGAVGAALATKLLVSEWRRVNDELHPAEPVREKAPRETIKVLRPDPVSGVYRPE